MFVHLEKKKGNVGCGTGLLGILSESFIGHGGKYIGIDVAKQDAEFCRAHYPAEHYEFVHFDMKNSANAPGQKIDRSNWPVELRGVDLVTALSVWTHLAAEDSLFFPTEMSRVPKSGGKAIIAFLLLDEAYQESLAKRSEKEGSFHATSQNRWIFDQPSCGSTAWLHPIWAEVPEVANGVTEAAIFEKNCSVAIRLQERVRKSGQIWTVLANVA